MVRIDTPTQPPRCLRESYAGTVPGGLATETRKDRRDAGRDIDFLRRQVHVRHQLRLLDRTFEIRLPTYNSGRTVHVPDALLQITLRARRTGCASRQAVRRSR